MRRILSVMIAFSCAINVFGKGENQIRRIVLERTFNCSHNRANAVIDMFVYQMQTDIHQLFSWAFIGTENTGDSKGKDAIAVKYHGNTYDANTRTGTLLTTIDVLGVPWFKNREIASIYRDTLLDSTRYARLDITYSGSLLQAANSQFHTKPIDATHTKIHFELNVILGKFFSSFVTMKTWNEVATWRIKVIMDNIIEYAETGTVNPKEPKINCK